MRVPRVRSTVRRMIDAAVQDQQAHQSSMLPWIGYDRFPRLRAWLAWVLGWAIIIWVWRWSGSIHLLGLACGVYVLIGSLAVYVSSLLARLDLLEREMKSLREERQM